MDAKQVRGFRIVLYSLAIALVICLAVHLIMVSRFNRTPHSNSGLASDQESYMDIRYRGGETSSWVKRDAKLNGMVYDGVLYNNSKHAISSWTLRINITGSCFLNQFWNGEVEVHQHVSSGNEKVQRLNLASYDLDKIELDYTLDATDLLIPLEKGDYIIYHPSLETREMPLDAKTEAGIGTIFYYRDNLDLTDYSLSFYYHMSFNEGVLFLVMCFLAGLWVLTFGMYMSAKQAYRRAQKEMNIKMSGISCMAGLYAVIYIIDLIQQTITPVSMDEAQDSARPKELTASEQMKHLFRTDPETEYQSLMLSFADLDTLPDRLKDRNSIAAEYKSRRHGWSRILFIAMDREEGKPIERVLFTIQQINEEKKELDEIREQMARAETESQEKRDVMENAFYEIQTPLNAILRLDDLILKSCGQEEILSYARDIKSFGSSVMDTVNSSLDYSLLASGRMRLALDVYSLREIADGLEQTALTSIVGKDIDFRTEIARGIPDRLYGDGPKLLQVLISILNRVAADLTSGTIIFRVFGKVHDDDHVHLLFSIQENGKHTYNAGAGQGLVLAEGMLALMRSGLKTADMGDGRDVYFELEQMAAGDRNKAEIETFLEEKAEAKAKAEAAKEAEAEPEVKAEGGKSESKAGPAEAGPEAKAEGGKPSDEAKAEAASPTEAGDKTDSRDKSEEKEAAEAKTEAGSGVNAAPGSSRSAS